MRSELTDSSTLSSADDRAGGSVSGGGETGPGVPRDGLSGRVADVAIALALLAFAVAVRLPYLHLVPRYTDEVKEVMWALRIYWGEQLPLAAHNGYSGPLWNYLLAVVFALLGPSPGVPREVVLVAGALTVVATYALGRSMDGRTASLVGGALMATSFVPVFVNSHVAWSICITPLLTTLALLALHRGVRSESGPALALSGLLVGLSMQAHPLGVLLVPPSTLWFLLQRRGRRMLHGPWPWIAALLVVVGYANMIWFHVSSRLATVTKALSKLSDGVPGAPTLGSYRHGVESLLFNMIDLLTAQSHHSTDLFRADPATFVRIASLLLLLVLVYGAWRKDSLPLIVVLSTVLLMPLFNSQYGFPLGARYLSFLLPVVYTGLGLTVAAALEALRVRSSAATAAGTVAVWMLVAALVIYPLLPLRRAYASAEASGQTNALVHEMSEAVASGHEAGARVLLSEKIPAKFSGGGHLHRVFATLLGLRGIRTEKVHKDLKGIDEQLEGCIEHQRAGPERAGRNGAGPCLLIISERQAQALAQRYQLQPIRFSGTPRPEDGESYGVYWVAPGPAGTATPAR
jgi:4-amino-4-deoxy-L-arabinose transferase-like glycosyltransferase